MLRAFLGEFESADQCASAIKALRERGHTRLDAYLPYPAKNVEEALAIPPSTLPRWVLAAGVLGATIGYLVLWWTQNVDYPLNVGGHPTNAVPAYIGITFETTVLFAAIAAFAGMLKLCGLPRLWHPTFELEGFVRASVDRFFVIVDVDHQVSGGDGVRTSLEELGALRVIPVELGGEAP